MQALFGEEFWQFTIVGVSHWSYSNEAVSNRNHSGESEQKFMAEWNSLLQEKFHIDIELQGVFIDAFSQRPWIEDENQEAAFQRETAKLWDFAQQNGLFTFRTVGDVLEENQELKDEIKWLNDVITNNISRLAESIAANSEEIAVNTEMIKENSGAISTNADAIEGFDSLPLGTILSWTPYPDKNTQNPSSIPPGWMMCDGSEINEGPWKGHHSPDINNSRRFLRGSIVGNALNTEGDSVNTYGLTVKDRAFHESSCVDGSYFIGSSYSGTCHDCSSDAYCEFIHSIDGGAAETRPINMNVVFIIKISN